MAVEVAAVVVVAVGGGEGVRGEEPADGTEAETTPTVGGRTIGHNKSESRWMSGGVATGLGESAAHIGLLLDDVECKPEDSDSGSLRLLLLF